MKANIALLGSTIEKSLVFITLLSLVFWIYPEVSQAASLQNQSTTQALVFEIKPTSKDEIQSSQLTYQEIVAADPLVKGVRGYLEGKNSPLAQYTAEIVKLPQWQRAIALTYPESNYCKMAANKNCGSVGGGPGQTSWRKYNTELDAIKDLSALLETPMYKERFTNCRSMRGIYVVPGSNRWVAGCESASNDLITLTNQAEAQRFAQANQPIITAATNEIVIVE